jgi:hypothetical protein
VKWFQIDSWHILREVQVLATGEDSEDVEWAVALCGFKSADAELLSERPGNEASCENCLRIHTKD